MTSSPRTLLILGASGDLTSRLLLPSLGELVTRESDDRTVTVRGAGVETWDQAHWTQLVTDAVGGAVESGRVSVGDYTALDVTEADQAVRR